MLFCLFFLQLVLACLLSRAYSTLPNYTPALNENAALSRDELISSYFNLGYNYKDILLCLAASHGFHMSIRTLKRVLRRLRLKRREPCTEDNVMAATEFIDKQLTESGQMVGYKVMWKRLQHNGFVIARDVVRQIMLHLDEKGVRQRALRRLKRRQYVNPGPNFVWHVDGYDKLKPYGFAIHGCIDGFSRRVLWLEVGITNNNPRVVVNYFLKTIRQMKTVPCVVRCDHGTENVHIRDVQVYLRSNDEDDFSGENSYLQGRSTSNQRIEAWWAILRKQCTNYWMNLFKDIAFGGLLDTGNPVHINALRFCFIDLIANDITRTAIEWNTHLIESRADAMTPKGKPDILYFQPELYNTESYGLPCPHDEITTLMNQLESDDAIPTDHDADFVDLVNEMIPDWEPPNNVNDGLDLYANILDSFALRN